MHIIWPLFVHYLHIIGTLFAHYLHIICSLFFTFCNITLAVMDWFSVCFQVHVLKRSPKCLLSKMKGDGWWVLFFSLRRLAYTSHELPNEIIVAFVTCQQGKCLKNWGNCWPCNGSMTFCFLSKPSEAEFFVKKTSYFLWILEYRYYSSMLLLDLLWHIPYSC